MKKERKILFATMIVLCLSLIACYKKTPEPMIANPVFPGNTDMGLDIEQEENYDQIKAYTEYTRYPADIEKILCTVINENVGKGFYLFPIPFIEYKENDTWLRLNYQPPELQYESNWVFCGIEGNKTESNQTVLIFETKDLKDKLKIGKYRLVVFVGDKIIYAPFEIEL